MITSSFMSRLKSLSGRSRKAPRFSHHTATADTLRVESLEGRILLATDEVTFATDPNNKPSQFGGLALDINQERFLGAEFDESITIGGIARNLVIPPGDYGLEAQLDFSGRAGFETGFFVNSGTVDVSYDAKLTHNYDDPAASRQVLSFDTEVELQNGSLQTQSPTLGAYADLVLELDAGARIEACFNTCEVLSPSGGLVDIDQELFAFNRDNEGGFRVLGQDQAAEILVPITPPIALKAEITGIENEPGAPPRVGIQETLSIVVGKGGGFEEKLGEATQTVPQLDLSGETMGPDGRLSDESRNDATSELATLSLELSKLLGPLGGIGGEKTFSVGPASVTITGVSFLAGPVLHAHQAVSAVSQNRLTYNFNRPVYVQTGSSSEAFFNTSTVTITPGEHLNVYFEGDPLEVTPTWELEALFQNKIQLDAGLSGTLEVGKLEADIDFGELDDTVKGILADWFGLTLPVTAGPLFEKTFETGTLFSIPVFDKSFSILEQAVSLDSFSIDSPQSPTLNINSFEDQGGASLRNAVTAANELDGQDMQIDLDPGTFTLDQNFLGLPDLATGDLDITAGNLTIKGAGSNETIIDASMLGDQAIQIMSSGSLTLQDLTVIGNVRNDGELTLDGATVTRVEGIPPVLVNSFVVNHAGDANDADPGDGFCATSVGTCTLRAATQESNAQLPANTNNIEFAGGVETINLLSALPELNRSIVIQGPGPDQLTVQRSTVVGTPSFRIFSVSPMSTVSISGITIANGHDSTGGGAILNQGDLTVTDSLIRDNSSGAGDGGGIFNARTLTVTDSTFHDNRATRGGAIFNFGGPEKERLMSVNTSTFFDNEATSEGGAIAHAFSSAWVLGSTFSGNRARTGAAIAIATPSDRQFTISNSTLSENRADFDGGGIQAFGNVLLQNSIVAGNFGAGGAVSNDITGPLSTESSFNLVGVDVGVTGITDGPNGNQMGTTAHPIDPGLAPLGDYGGLTLTHAPLPDSPAVDQGNTSAMTDQRGQTRPVDVVSYANATGGNGSDIGAVELRRFFVNSTADRPDTIVGDGSCETSTGTCTLRAAIQEANASPGTEVIEFLASLGVISLNTAIPEISTNMAIVGPGAEQLTLQRNNSPATSDFRILSVLPGVTVSVSELTIANGRDSAGGGILNQGELTLTDSIVRDNTSVSGDGGGIYNVGTLTVVDSTLYGNQANRGGAIFNFRDSTVLSVHNSTLFDNEANNEGGAVANAFGTAEIFTSTISGNRARTGGGFASAGSDGRLTIGDSTLTNNRATVEGGGIQTFGTVLLQNSIIAGNDRANDLRADDISGPVDATSAFNLVGVDTGFSGIVDGANGNQIGTTGNPIDPSLAPLGDYGGSTLTHALLPESHGVDRGNTTAAEDQRGHTRPIDIAGYANASGGNGSDIGAFELQQFVVNTTSDTPDADVGDGVADTDLEAPGLQTSLRAAIQEANASPDWNLVEFDFSTPTTITLHNELPRLAGPVVIQGPGAPDLTVRRSDSDDTPRFRIFTTDASVTLAGLTISGGRAPARGGGILNLGDLVVDGVVLNDNHATEGGGLHNSTGSSVTIRNSTLSDNSASFFGGGVSSDVSLGGELTITDTTLSGNTARIKGGAVSSFAAAGAGPVTISRSTVTGNYTEGSGGGISQTLLTGSSAMELRNTLIAGNLSGPDFSADDFDGIIDGDSAYNLVGVDTGLTGISSAVNGNHIGTASVPLVPRLGPLTDNHGPTPTHALLPTSPAIDAGFADPQGPATDQRGLPRITDVPNIANVSGGQDIGAFEFDGFVTATVNSIADGDHRDEQLTLHEALLVTSRELDQSLLTEAEQSQLQIDFDADRNLVQFALPTPSEITLEEELPQLNSRLDIVGPGVEDLTVRRSDAEGTSDFRIFTIGAEGQELISGFRHVSISELTIAGGKANSGGGILNQGELSLRSAAVLDNEAALTGGGIMNLGALTVRDTRISSNSAGNTGGGIHNAGRMWLNSSLVAQNSTWPGGNDFGGGVYNSGDAIVGGTSFRNNSTLSGAGVYNAGTFSLSNSIVNNNSASGDGGGLRNNGDMTVSETSFDQNSASFGGGGIWNHTEGILTVEQSTLRDNTADFGGGVANGGRLQINGSTLSGNEADRGGGFFANTFFGSPLGSLTMTNSTVTENRAESSGGGLVSNVTTTLANSLVAGNRRGLPDDSTPDDLIGMVNGASSYNLIGVDTGLSGIADGVNGNRIGTLGTPINPRLGPLADNGGPALTHALLSDSPAIDAGATLQTYAEEVRGLGPLGYWRLDDDVTTGTATNSGTVGIAADGTIERDPISSAGLNLVDTENSSILFDGEDDIVRIPGGGLLSAATDRFSIELMFKTGDLTRRQVVYEQGGLTQGFNVYVEPTGTDNAGRALGSLVVGAWKQSGQDFAGYLNTEIATSRTYHLVLVFDASATDPNSRFLEGYLNGASIGRLTSADIDGTFVTQAAHGDPIGIGGLNGQSRVDNDLNTHSGTGTEVRETGGGLSFLGTIDEVAVYHEALNPTDVAAHYLTTLNTFPAFDQRGAPFARVAGETVDIGAYELSDVLRVNDVLVRGSLWNSDIPSASLVNRSDPDRPLPWINLDQVQIVFSASADVNSSSLTLLVADNAQELAASDFQYDPESHVATWTFPSPLNTGRFLMNVAGESTDTTPVDDQPGAGGNLLNGGSDFEVHFNVLQGDATGDGRSDIVDLVNIATRLPASSTSPNYDARFDVNGDGRIDVGDLVNVAARVPSTLPSGEPLAAITSEQDVVDSVFADQVTLEDALP